ncbi:MAG: type II secretion system minor pseudopilin GspI [Gammaproteobacteria bacterium]|nr:type II secretion system minor pseudopilin GspI [Gammaproteobacteria bacterium]
MNHKYCKPHLHAASRGFTLLEVLVALVIVSLGMIAVFSQLNQMLMASSRLRDKTLAHWIAVDQITELQAINAYPKVGERRDELNMARATWSYTVKTSQIGDLAMRRVDVTVAFSDSPDQILAEVSGFLAPPQQTSAQIQQQQPGSGQGPAGTGNQTDGSRFGGGWDPLDPNEYQSDGS